MVPVRRNQNWLPSIFNDFLGNDWLAERHNTTAPAVNIIEDENEYKVEVAAPGMTKEDFKVHINEDNELIVTMEKKAEQKEEDKKKGTYLRREFSYTKFQQSLLLPDNVVREKIAAKVEELSEVNPMLGHRGCRLGNTYPEITEMQTRAIIEAAMNVRAAGIPVHVEIMVPLVGNHKELRYQKQIIDSTAEQVFSERNDKIDYMVGTMIEVPRAAVTAHQIAEVAEFFSFGTNDLTQMMLGFSRDDIGKFLPIYLDKGILKNDPFQILDQNGVGQLIREAVFKGRGKRPMLKCGICGEHGGEPSSVEFCHYAGLNYVSCSPFRVPIARLAAAHAALKEK